MPTPAHTLSRLSHKTVNVLFGNVVHGKFELNEFGRILVEEWERSKDIRQEVALDAFVAMPNHIHGVVHHDKPRCRGDRPVALSLRAVQTFPGCLRREDLNRL